MTIMFLTTQMGGRALDERHLLLLGVLMAQSQHGYRINEFIETNLGRVSGMKRSTAYALLERLEQKGLVQMDIQTVGNHPPRKVYSITPAGREKFFDLLQSLLVRVDPSSSAADIALMFMDYLPAEKAIALLKERSAELRAQIEELRGTPSHTTTAPGVDHAVRRKIALLAAEQSWLEETLDTLTAKAASAGNAAHDTGRKDGDP